MNHTEEPWKVEKKYDDTFEITTARSNRAFERKIGVTRYASDSFRAVVCVNALKGIKKPKEFISEAIRLIKTAGVLLPENLSYNEQITEFLNKHEQQ